MTVTAQLRRALVACGENRATVSRGAGVPESALSRFASGKSTLGGENIDKVCDYLGLVLTERRKQNKKG